MKKYFGIRVLGIAALAVGAAVWGQTRPGGEAAGNPPGISVSLKSATLEEVAAALAKATGVVIVQEEMIIGSQVPGAPVPAKIDNGERYTLEVKDRPFWEVIQALHKQHVFDFWENEGKWCLTKEQMSMTSLDKGVRAGGFLVRIDSVERKQVADYQMPAGQQVGSEGLTVSVEVTADPRIRLWRMKPLRLVEVVDENGTKLFGGGKQEHLQEMDNYSAGKAVGAAWMKVPEKMGKKMARFKAEADVVVCVGEKLVEVADVEKMKEPLVLSRQTVDVSTTGNGKEKYFRVEVESRRPESGRIEDRVLPLTLKLVDSKGEQKWLGAVKGTSVVYMRSTDAGAGAFDGPLKLVVGEPTGFEEVTVPFEVRDVALP